MHQRKNIVIGVLLAGVACSTIVRAQAIPMRGLRSDLSSSADRFVSADFNGDGKADMLYFRPGSGYAGAYLSHGDGTFRYVTYVNNGHGSSGFPGDLSSPNDKFVVLDLNGDGKSDFIQYRPGIGYTIRCLSNGDGTVQCDNLSTPGTKSSNFQDDMLNSNTRIVELPRRGASSEFLVYTPGSSTANFYIQQPGSTSLQAVSLSSNPNLAAGLSTIVQSASVNIVSLDSNGDGLPDMLVYATSNAGSSAGIACLYVNNGNNTFTRKTLSSPGSGFTGNPQDPNAHAIALDLNGDGKQDFLWWQAGSHVVTGYLSNGDGTFEAINYQSNGSQANGFEDDSRYTDSNAVAVDLNGDGKQDFIWYSPGNYVVTAYLSSATGALTGASYGGGGDQFGSASSQSIALPLNFLGQAASAFVWYTPGSGQNGGQPFFRAYTLANADTNSSLFGQLNHFDFFTYPGNFLSELNWSIGNVPLKEIVMPGTHDSSMYNLNFGTSDDRETQLGDYTHQLAYGARAFDFRMGYLTPVDLVGNYADPGGSKYALDTSSAPSAPGFAMTGHGNTATGYMTQDVLNTLETWLFQNPNEVIVLYMVQSISGTGGSFTSAFADLLKGTTYPDMIYTQQMACGTVPCKNYNVQPQNMTVNQLQHMGPLPNGARLILLNGDSGLSQTQPGWQWGNSASAQVGYCEQQVQSFHYSGASDPQFEITCINFGDFYGNSSTPSNSLRQARPSFQAADAATVFTPMVAALTPFGIFTNPLLALTGPIGLSDEFNKGSNPYDLNNQLAGGAWNAQALNTVSIDGLGGDGELVTPLLIQRNNQTWVDAHFFNNNADTPASAISIGANGDIWAAGSGHSIALFKFNTATGTWIDVINGLPYVKKLAADPQGGVYVIQGTSAAGSSGTLLHYDKNGTKTNTDYEIVQDVAVGKDGVVWIAASGVVKEVNLGGGLNTLQNGTHAGTHVAVDNLGRPWITQTDTKIYRYDGSSWIEIAAGSEGLATEIVASAEGSVFVTGNNQASIFRYNPQTDQLDPLIMDAAHIAVEPGGQPWVIRTGTGKVYKGSLDQM